MMLRRRAQAGNMTDNLWQTNVLRCLRSTFPGTDFMGNTRTQTPFDVVAIAASAGGLRALRTVLSALPVDFPAAVMVVQHVQRDRPSHLAELLNQHARLEVKTVEQSEPIMPGIVYIAQPDWHLEVSTHGIVLLTQTPAVHFSRPSAERLFETVAEYYKSRAIAVVLTGTGSDGSIGVSVIKSHGGMVIVQDPADADYDGMPMAAIRTGCADLVLPLHEIAQNLIELVMPGTPHDHE
jgi:two-component system chemotaxis response regulator CheB